MEQKPGTPGDRSGERRSSQIMVALIGAIGLVVATLLPSLLTSSPEPSAGHPTTATPPSGSTPYQGLATLRHANPEIDLDSLPDGSNGDHVGDLVHTAMALTTSKNSLLALLDPAQQPTLDICRSALTTHGVRRIPASQLDKDLSLCVRTTAGHTGAITLNDVRKYSEPKLLGQIVLFYRIWN